MRTKNMTIPGAFLFCMVSMGVMLFTADTKAITIANVAQDQVENDAAEAPGLSETEKVEGSLLFTRDGENSAFLRIPLAEGVRAEHVTIENHYAARQVWIYIETTEPSYYERQAISGNITHITAGSFETAGEKVLLKFTLTDIYECKSVLEENGLYIEFVPPGEVYDKIIVLDACAGGEDTGIIRGGLVEKELSLDIVKRVKLLLEGSGIKVYYTRMDDSTLGAETRAALANDVEADMLISIGLNESSDSVCYGVEAFYNASFFLPESDNVSLADLVEREVVIHTIGRGNGLYAAEDSVILLAEAEVPSCLVKVGYASNEREAALLQKEEYRERIAKGIFEAIGKFYEEGMVSE